MHMFDIDVPGGIRFQESEVLSPGNGFLTFDTGTISTHSQLLLLCYDILLMTTCSVHFSKYPEWCKIGVGICYDMRFQELASVYNQKGN